MNTKEYITLYEAVTFMAYKLSCGKTPWPVTEMPMLYRISMDGAFIANKRLIAEAKLSREGHYDPVQ